MRKLLTTTALLALMLPLQGCLGVKIVDTGNRGIEVRFGKVEGAPLPEGMYFYNPFTTSIVEMATQTQKKESDLETYTKDIQQAKLHVVVNYNLDREHAGDMYREVGYDWENKLVQQAIEGSLKAVIGKWDAVDLIANRAKAQADIQANVASALAPHYVVVSNVQISNIDYTSEFEQAVEAKVKAIQEAEQAKNNTARVDEEAKQTVLRAKADAEAMQIKSQALSQNQNLVAYEAVQKWDGVMPVTMLGSTMPFINLGAAKQ
jgi:prohibitin 2